VKGERSGDLEFGDFDTDKELNEEF